MKAIAKLGIAMLMSTTAALVAAQEHPHAPHAPHQAAAQEAAAAATELTEGEVRKIDKETGKITLRHGEIKNLGMAAMTMVLRVKDAAMLDALQVGDKVMFAAERVNGAVTIVQMHKEQ